MRVGILVLCLLVSMPVLAAGQKERCTHVGASPAASIGRRLVRKMERSSRKLADRRLDSRRYVGRGPGKSDRRLSSRDLMKKVAAYQERLRKERVRDQERHIRATKDLLRKKKKRGY